MGKLGKTAINVSDNVRFLINEVEGKEGLRVKRALTHEEFIMFLTYLYKRVAGDTMALDAAWEKVNYPD
uniref:Uncharacterized protein n=1 Tax=viral metagenome TaxID=1070528 RepID=A0A6H1ZWP3_9ZZZZ